MQIPITEVRKIWGYHERDIKPYSLIPLEVILTQVGGVKILTPMKTEYSECCYWFIFKEEEWYQKLNPRKLADYFMESSDSLLLCYGYEEIEIPKENSIIAYHFKDAPYGQVKHYGIFQNGKVKSKFGTKHIYEHNIASVPDHYGDSVKFYRKNLLTLK